MPLGNREGGSCEEAESEYLPDMLCKELRDTVNCTMELEWTPFFAQRAEKGAFL